MEDTEVVRRCLAGGRDSYGLIVDRYGSRIFNLAFAMLGDRHEAEDLAQEVFVRAYRGLRGFKRRAKFSSWLYRIALNLCRDRLKAMSRRARGAEEGCLESFGGGPREQAFGATVERELSEKMLQAIGRLPPLYRECFVLRHLHGKGYDEVAAITGAAADTVRVRAYRAREMLREALSRHVDTFWREKAARENKGGGANEKAREEDAPPGA